MKRITRLSIPSSILVILSLLTTSMPGQVPIIEKASFTGSDPVSLLSLKAVYPKDGLTRQMQGDVILSFIVSKQGTLDSMKIVSSPGRDFSASALSAITSIKSGWKPATVNGDPADKKYLTIFRYRMYLNSGPVNYRERVIELFREGKYEKALKACNTAIKENRYDYILFDYRSQIRTKLGDIEGSEDDRLTSVNLYNELMLFVDINAIGISRTVPLRTEIIRY
jgi:TonB family protein